jgi:type IV pilus assembly protein PilB
MNERLKLGELLVETGLITEGDLARALEQQKEDPRRLGELLVDGGAVTESQVTQVLSQQLSVPWVSLQHIDFSRQLLNLVPKEIAEKHGIVPIYVRRARNRQETLYVAMEDPSDVAPLREVEAHAGVPVRPMIAPATDIRAAIRAYYLGLPPEEEVAVESVHLPLAKPVSLPPRAPSVRPPTASPAADVVISEPPAVAPAPRMSIPPPPPVGDALPSRGADLPRPRGGPAMVTLTMLDGTQIALPRNPLKKGKADSSGAPVGEGLTARDLIDALRAQAGGADTSEVLGKDVNWERMFAALLSLLLKKHLIVDWEFVRELRR